MEVREISLNKIKLGKNSRLRHDEGDLSSLMLSIKENGLLQPIGVMPKNGHYEVCYGNRRFLAASKLGLSSIPAVIQEPSTKKTHDAEIKNLTENIQRRNISLAEAGRYIDLLTKDGLTEKEIAARLGVTANYVKSCLAAFREVPEEFRDDLEVRIVGGGKVTPGKIPVSTAQAIISAQKTLGFSQPQLKQLFQAAKTRDDFQPQNVKKYAMALMAGKKDFINTAKPLKYINTRFLMDPDEYDSLKEKYVDEGPYRSVGQLFAAILKGEKHLKVRIVKA